mgnify:CR=1 FL=1
MTNWTPQQDAALKAVRDWLRTPGGKQWFYLAGYAGTGKTTLARHLAEGVDGPVLFGAYTGKAALVLRSKGCEGARTIHSMIYRPEQDEEGNVKFVLDRDSEVADADLIVIDEVSMVDEALARDLLSFQVPVLVLGDPAQLPPVNGEGYFTSREPDFMLTEVHRQARDNPIIEMSMRVREGRRLSVGSYGDSKVVRLNDIDRDEVLAADQIIVGRNVTRQRYNARMRQLRGFYGDLPNPGERIVCLRNNRERGLLNGQIWTVEAAEFETVFSGRRKAPSVNNIVLDITDEMTGDAVSTRARIEDFRGEKIDLPPRDLKKFDRFDFGYALTCHKAQGSQWDSVYLFDESFVFGEDRARWLYTGITRAAEKITIVH